MGGGSSAPQNKIITRTILILGDNGVGKTHLIKCLGRKQYNQVSDKTTKIKLEDTVKFKDDQSKDQTHLTLIELPLIDGDVSQKDKSQFYPKADAAIFLYDLTNHASFENIPKWVQDFEKHNKTQYKFLIGTKKDLSDKHTVTLRQSIKMSVFLGLLKGKISVLSFQETARQFVAIIGNIKQSRHGQQKEPDYTYKITIVGNANAGKTALTERLTMNKFTQTIPTLGIEVKNKLMVDPNNSYKFVITDTSGCENIRLKMYQYLQKADAVILVFDASHRRGEESLVPWFEEIQKHCSEDKPILILGNKADIVEKVQIQSPQALFLSKNYPFLFCSAKTGLNIDLIIQVLLTKFAPPIKDKQALQFAEFAELLKDQSFKEGNGLKQMLILNKLLSGLKGL